MASFKLPAIKAQLSQLGAKRASLPIKLTHLRILIEAVLVVYLIALFSRIYVYGSMSKDQLFAVPMPFDASAVFGGSAADQDSLSLPAKGKVEFPLNVFLVNTPNYHFEVFVPVIETFAAVEGINTTVFTTEAGTAKWGLRNAMEVEVVERNNLPLVEATNEVFDNMGVVPDFIFLTTCPEDMRVLGQTLTNALAQGAHVMCIVHQAHLWDYKKIDQYAEEISYMRPWIQRGQWHFATLSKHVHTYVRSNFPQFLDTPNREYRPLLFHPIFNYSTGVNLDFNSNQPFAIIPGKFESERRNYNKIFTEYGQLGCDIALRLVGSGKIPNIADAFSQKIGFITNLNFFEFFQEMSKGVAIIPTLGNEHYLKSQSSSSVATSIIAGTPLIASQAFLTAHSQIPPEAVWMQGETETELQVLQRIGHYDSKQWKEKKDRVLQLRDDLIRENVSRVSRMLNIIGARYKF
ncbi:hypothetical protein V1514DRAFT_321625 [Lipomyces japonicus]|uniref:uncharacterized protein n=1 Tax=Lipomyces japonicus TaxID=56871 RepID=UPI0034CE16DF